LKTVLNQNGHPTVILKDLKFKITVFH